MCLLVSRPLEDNTFLIFNLLLDGNNAEAARMLKDLKINGVEPVTLISQLANQFRLLNQVSYLYRKKYTQEEIAKELKIKPGRAYVLSKYVYKISEKTIHQVLDDLYQLDLDIKSGQVDRYYAFEMFLLKFKTQ